MEIAAEMANREVAAYAQAGHAELAFERAVAAIDVFGEAFTAWRELTAVVLERMPDVAPGLLALAASRLESGACYRTLAEILPRGTVARVCVAACESGPPHPEAVRIGLVAAMQHDDTESLSRLLRHVDVLEAGVGAAIERRALDLGKSASAALLASAQQDLLLTG